MRQALQSGLLVARALWELFRYDLVLKLSGFERIHAGNCRLGRRNSRHDSELEKRVCQSVKRAIPLYWKPALCLQRSVATARLLRIHGVDASVVIGYRSEPFFSHAWVEVGGRVVNDSPAYQQRLCVLDRI